MTRVSESDAVGVVLEGRYRVESAIGGAHAGGMVYRGRDTETGVTVVIRCPAVPDGVRGAALENAFAAFLVDAGTLVRISAATADVEKLLAHGVAEPTPGEKLPYCVFEWLAGRSLERHLAERANQTSSLSEAMVLLEPAARALAAAHAMGAAHRDVRPANLWLAEADGRTRMKLAAFALASRVGVGDTPFAPEYGAPEHFKKSYGKQGPETDVYGLALCLVEMVTGRRPLEGADETELYLVTSDLARRPTLRANGAQVSDAVEQVVARALAVDPKRRYGSAREFWDALVAAVPELTPSVPSVAPKPQMRPMSIPPGASGPIFGSMFSTRPPPPMGGEDVSPSQAPPPDAPRGLGPATEKRRAPKTWMIVAVLALVGILVMGVKLGANRRPVTASTEAGPEGSSTPTPLTSGAASPSSSEEAVRLQPFLTDMVKVPKGTFTMGSEKYEKIEKPAHKVTLTRAFYIDRTEVTAQAYASCVEDGKCKPNTVHNGDVVETTYGCNTDKNNPRHPVNCVDRMQAAAYCASVGKRLPTEAEWEYAARGSADERDYPWGNDAPTTCAKAVALGVTGPCTENRKGTFDVGSAVEGKSPFGALDMAGNVWEWVADGYQDYPPVADGSDTEMDPKVEVVNGGRAILRGGSYDYSPAMARLTNRLPFPATSANVSMGFRCARDAE